MKTCKELGINMCGSCRDDHTSCYILQYENTMPCAGDGYPKTKEGIIASVKFLVTYGQRYLPYYIAALEQFNTELSDLAKKIMVLM
jgi:hypothetical protein